MDVILNKHIFQKKIGSFLIFFCVFFFLSCNQKVDTSSYEILFQNGEAIAIRFNSIESNPDFKITLKDSKEAMLGNFTKKGSTIVFTPIIPFTKGENYQILKSGKSFLEFQVDKSYNEEKPKVLAIYPKIDTVPENLLKMYLVFSKPMQQTKSTLDFVKVVDLTANKQVDIFLPLENELWNNERTQLTLWLDPGRIKKDLIPNKEKGIPIQQGHRYKLVIDVGLDDKNGISLDKEYQKIFYVSGRDTQKPFIGSWKIKSPKASTNNTLEINFGESLDYLLLQETIRVYKNQEEIFGNFEVLIKANGISFIPDNKWERGHYRIKFESRLEDLAGNNLNRLFDHDLQDNNAIKRSEFYSLNFIVE